MITGSRVGEKMGDQVQVQDKPWVPGRELGHTRLCTQSVPVAVSKATLPLCGHLWFCTI